MEGIATSLKLWGGHHGASRVEGASAEAIQLAGTAYIIKVSTPLIRTHGVLLST